jgi:hypothetical protein
VRHGATSMRPYTRDHRSVFHASDDGYWNAPAGASPQTFRATGPARRRGRGPASPLGAPGRNTGAQRVTFIRAAPWSTRVSHNSPRIIGDSVLVQASGGWRVSTEGPDDLMTVAGASKILASQVGLVRLLERRSPASASDKARCSTHPAPPRQTVGGRARKQATIPSEGDMSLRPSSLFARALRPGA